MSIDDMHRPGPFPVEHWRAVLHDAIDQVLDELLDAARHEWLDDLEDLREDELLGDELFGEGRADDDPPGDPPSAQEIAAVGESLRASLTAAIVDGTRVWGCDATLRCTGEWAERQRLPADRVIGEYRRAGITCDCAVLHGVLGRTDIVLRCPAR